MPKAAKNSPTQKATKPKTSAATMRAAAKAPRLASKSSPELQSAVESARSDTKAAAILKMLGRDNGATIKELAAATNWQEHSIRGLMSGNLKKKRGLLITHSVVDGIRRYHINQPGSGQ